MSSFRPRLQLCVVGTPGSLITRYSDKLLEMSSVGTGRFKPQEVVHALLPSLLAGMQM